MNSKQILKGQKYKFNSANIFYPIFTIEDKIYLECEALNDSKIEDKNVEVKIVNSNNLIKLNESQFNKTKEGDIYSVPITILEKITPWIKVEK